MPWWAGGGAGLNVVELVQFVAPEDTPNLKVLGGTSCGDPGLGRRGSQAVSAYVWERAEDERAWN